MKLPKSCSLQKHTLSIRNNDHRNNLLPCGFKMNKSPKLRAYLKIICLVRPYKVRDGEIRSRTMWGSDVGFRLKMDISRAHLYTLDKLLVPNWHWNISLTQCLVHISTCYMLGKTWPCPRVADSFNAEVGHNYASMWPVLWPRNTERATGELRKGHQSQSGEISKGFQEAQ